jgi:BirA family transcriptional regulator, biotin operon repressor / biotin---[acetyl-CoA-carboxylase] ligase
MNFKIHHFKSLTSTQDKAKELAKNGISDAVIISETQTKGRGRMNRKWLSSPGNLFMSIIIRPKGVENIQHLTFAAAICVVKSIKKIAGISTKIKWPNDVNYKGKKLCGILTEGIFGSENCAIVGIGLNVNQKKFSKDLPNAISLYLATTKQYEVRKFTEDILGNFEKYVQKYNSGKLKEIRAEWLKFSDTIGKKITINTLKKEIKGTAIGINDDCSLKIKTKNKIISVYEGDVSIRY